MKIDTPLKKATFAFLFFMMVVAAVYGLIVVGEYIGDVTASHSGHAGNIYSLVIQHQIPVTEWAGLYGGAFSYSEYNVPQFQEMNGGGMDQENLIFNCIDRLRPNEIFASLADPDTIDLSSMTPATAAEVDTFLGKNPADFDSATNTFTQTMTFNLGTTSITVPGTYTYKLDESGSPATFALGIAKDNANNLVFVAHVTNFTQGFNGQIYNFQFMLPIPENTSQTYYFYRDPNDECPAGEGEQPPKGYLIGNVTDTLGQRVSDVIIEVAGLATLSDTTGFYNLSTFQGTHRIYAIKTGYDVYINNVTITPGNTTRHDIVLVPEAVENPNTGVGPGQDDPGTGSDVGPDFGPDQGPDVGPDQGPGEIPPIPYVEQPTQIEGIDYIISLNELRRKIRLGSFLQERLFVFSFKKSTATVTFELQGNVTHLVELDTDQLILEPNSNDQVVLTIFGRGEPGLYNGSLLIDGDINATIPVEIEVLTKEKLPVESLQIQLDTAQKELLPNQMLKFKTDLRNMLIEHPYSVKLFFSIQSADGGPAIWTSEENVYLRTAFSLIKSTKLPANLKPGDYILRVTAEYLGLSSATSTIFRVNVPFWQRSLLGLRYWHWFLIFLAVAALVGGFFYYRRWQEGKKKFHLKVEMNELPKPGPRSIFVGKIAETDHRTYFNLEAFKTHTIVAGSTGGGKSVSAQVIIEEALEKDIAVIVFDPTAQWTGMLRPCKDKTMFSLYPYFGMKKTDARAFNGNIRMILDAREQIEIMDYAKPGEIQVFCFHKLDPKDMDIVVANAIRSVFRSGPQESKPLRLMFVFDEVHRLLPKFGGSGDGFLQIERACREFRKWGLGVMLVSQVLSDFVGTIKANINTEVQMRTRDEGDLERIRQKYGEDVLRSLVKATVGSGMVENPAYNRGKPYFVAFRPLKHSVERMSDEEIQKYNDYNDKMDSLFFSLDQLEEAGVDVFDLRLELKLALDKVKSGNFNMVDVYLEGLTPRIDKQWEKLGKKPKKFERKMVDLAELKADIEKAKQERDKYVADQEAKKSSGGEEKKEIGWKDDVPPEQMLNLVNGMIVINLASLYDEISAMKEEDFAKHVIEGKKNDFAKWVMDSIGDTKLAYNLYATTDQQEMLSILEKKKNKEELPDAKPPAWVGKQAQTAPEEKETPAGEEKPKQEGEGQPTDAKPEEKVDGGHPEADQPPAGEQPAEQPQEKKPEGEAPPAAPEQPSAQPAAPPAAPEPPAPEQQPAPEQPREAGPDQEHPSTAGNKEAMEEFGKEAPEPTPDTTSFDVGGALPKELATKLDAATISEEKIRILEEAKDASPTDTTIMIALAKEYAKAGKSGEALDTLEIASHLGELPADAQALQEQLQKGEGKVPVRQPAPEQPPAQPAAPPAAPEQPPAQPAAPPAAPEQQAPVQPDTSRSALEALVAQDPNKYFHLENGMELKSVSDLKEYLPKMDESIFTKHVSGDYNHFADWVEGVFHETGLASRLRSATSRDEMTRILEQAGGGVA